MGDGEETRIVVTEENFGELLVEGLREILAIQRREARPARRIRYYRGERGGRRGVLRVSA